MIFRSKAPLRIGLAGGGTDVSPYCDQFGGAILNATLSLYAHATLMPSDDGMIHFISIDQNQSNSFPWNQAVPTEGGLALLKGVYNRIQKDFPFQMNGLTLSTSVDAPAGSGLGTSSTLVVAIIGAFVEMLKLPMGEYDIAKYAFDIERNDLKLAGGRQDQYAATFGGINFMEFYNEDKVIVNPLRIKQEYLNELENNLILFFTATTRESAKIIHEQQQNVLSNNTKSIEAMHFLKEQAKMMKEALLTGQLNKIGEILNYGFLQKKNMAHNISNPTIENIYTAAIHAGATGGKISGAGGGGFMIFYCPGNTRYPVIETLNNFKGQIRPYQLTKHGLTTWTSQ